jgi:hypothetical protein
MNWGSPEEVCRGEIERKKKRRRRRRRRRRSSSSTCPGDEGGMDDGKRRGKKEQTGMETNDLFRKEEMSRRCGHPAPLSLVVWRPMCRWGGVSR